jgi:hypothetical protein
MRRERRQGNRFPRPGRIGFVVIRGAILESRTTFATARGGSDAQRLVQTDPFHWSYMALQAGH